MTKKYQAPIVKKAFDILRIIAKASQGMRISEISSRLDISKSTVHGITAALEDQGAIIRDPVSKQYTIGLTLIELGKNLLDRIDLKKTARPIMEELMEVCEESVFLGLRNGNHVTVIDIVESRKDFKITSPIGTSIPLLAGAIGKVFLSQMTHEDAEKYLKSTTLSKFTANTLNSVDEYLKQIEIVRKNGYATDDEEYISGVRAVAAPIKGYGTFLAAIWVVGFKPNLDVAKMEFLTRHAKVAALKISHRLKTAD